MNVRKHCTQLFGPINDNTHMTTLPSYSAQRAAQLVMRAEGTTQAAVFRSNREARAWTVPGQPITILGRGALGGKARQLLIDTPYLHAAGFRSPYRFMLADGFFDANYRALGMGENARAVARNLTVGDLALAREAIANVNFSVGQTLLLESALNFLGHVPVAVRSSGFGDAIGSGIYHTEYSAGTLSQVLAAVRTVLASNFGDDAHALRELEQGGGEFGVIIEPLVGQEILHEYGHRDPRLNTGNLTPILSGTAYTSTPDGPAQIRAWPGLGGGVTSRYAERINEDTMRAFEGDLSEYCYETFRRMYMGESSYRRSHLLRYYGPRRDRVWKTLAWSPRSKNTTSMSHRDDSPFGRIIHTVNTNTLFGALGTFEAFTEQPHYLEWALTTDPHPTLWALQSTPVVTATEDFTWGVDPQQVVVRSHTVKGTGPRSGKDLVFILNHSGLEAMRRWNRDHHDYVLVYAARLITDNPTIARLGQLRFADSHRASIVYEFPDIQHSKDIAEHDLGKHIAAGHHFGVLDDTSVQGLTTLLNAQSEDRNGLQILRGDFTAMHSPRRGEGVLIRK